MFVAFFSRGFSSALSSVCDMAQNDVIKGLVTSSAQVSSLSTLTWSIRFRFPTCNEIKWNAIWLWIDRLNLLPKNFTWQKPVNRYNVSNNFVALKLRIHRDNFKCFAPNNNSRCVHKKKMLLEIIAIHIFFGTFQSRIDETGLSINVCLFDRFGFWHCAPWICSIQRWKFIL